MTTFTQQIDRLVERLTQLANNAKNYINAHRLPAAVTVAVVVSCATSLSLALNHQSNSNDNGASITQDVRSLLSDSSNNATSGPDVRLYRSGYTRADDTADSMLLNLGVLDANAANFIRTNSLTQEYLLGSSNRLITAETQSDGRSLKKLTELWINKENNHQYQELVIIQNDQGQLSSTLTSGPLTVSSLLVSGVVNSTFYESTQAANIPFNVAAQMLKLFSPKINLNSHIQPGARYTVVYQVLEGAGQTLDAGRVLGTEFYNAGTKYSAIWFDPKKEENQLASSSSGGYYSLSGESLFGHRFLSTPIHYTRISSPFGERFDPYLHKWGFHEGIDLAAPSGTSIHAVGNGRVTFAGVQNGYGNVVIIEHSGGISTLYAHMSKIKVHTGEEVKENKVIGLVGETGWATGPHIHFEFRVDGQRKNPLVALNKYSALPLKKADRAAFSRVAQSMSLQFSQSTEQVAEAKESSSYSPTAS